MGELSKFAESLPEGFGYVIFAYVGNEFVNMWMAINVGRARKQYEVEVSTYYCVLGEERANLSAFRTVCSICACLVLSVSSSSWCLGRAAACDCDSLLFF